MVKYSEEKLDAVLRALADPTRRALLARLTRQELHVTDLAQPFNMSLAAVSKHLKVLSDAGMVKKTKEGRNYVCRANLEPLAQVTQLLEELGSFWRTKLDTLDRLLSAPTPNSKSLKQDKRRK